MSAFHSTNHMENLLKLESSAEEALYHLLQGHDQSITSHSQIPTLVETMSDVKEDITSAKVSDQAKRRIQRPSLASKEFLPMKGMVKKETVQKWDEPTKVKEGRVYSVARQKKSALQLMKEIKLLRSNILSKKSLSGALCSPTSFATFRRTLLSGVLKHQETKDEDSADVVINGDKFCRGKPVSTNKYAVRRRVKSLVERKKITKLESLVLGLAKQKEEFQCRMARHYETVEMLNHDLKCLRNKVETGTLASLNVLLQ